MNIDVCVCVGQRQYMSRCLVVGGRCVYACVMIACFCVCTAEVCMCLCRLPIVFLRTALNDRLLNAPAVFPGLLGNRCCHDGGDFRPHLETDLSSVSQ